MDCLLFLLNALLLLSFQKCEFKAVETELISKNILQFRCSNRRCVLEAFISLSCCCFSISTSCIILISRSWISEVMHSTKKSQSLRCSKSWKDTLQYLDTPKLSNHPFVKVVFFVEPRVILNFVEDPLDKVRCLNYSKSILKNYAACKLQEIYPGVFNLNILQACAIFSTSLNTVVSTFKGKFMDTCQDS